MGNRVAAAVLLSLSPLCVGIVSSLVSGVPDGWYRSLKKPWWTPPNYVFGPAWTILYVLMGYASFRVYDAQGVGAALGVFWAQLLLNALWSPVFFRYHKIGLSLALILCMLGLVIADTVLFWQADAIGGALLLPYVAWLCLATSLNAAVREPAPRTWVSLASVEASVRVSSTTV